MVISMWFIRTTRLIAAFSRRVKILKQVFATDTCMS